jgi:uncharacterized protein
VEKCNQRKKMKFKDYIKNKKIIIGMIHVKALPGTPLNNWPVKKIIEYAIEEGIKYKEKGIDTVIIENMFDTPYTKKIRPEIISMMSVIGHEIKKLGLYCGIQILAGGNHEALAVAKACELDFIRAEGYVYAHVGDEGIFESCAGELLRYRKQINAEEVLVFTDIKKKHSAHEITKDVDIVETAQSAEFFLSDGVIITGASTGIKADLEEVKKVSESVNIPILIGSGITKENLKDYFSYADMFIVGSFFKENSDWKNEIDERKIEDLVKEFERLNNKK